MKLSDYLVRSVAEAIDAAAANGAPVEVEGLHELPAGMPHADLNLIGGTVRRTDGSATGWERLFAAAEPGTSKLSGMVIDGNVANQASPFPHAASVNAGNATADPPTIVVDYTDLVAIDSPGDGVECYLGSTGNIVGLRAENCGRSGMVITGDGVYLIEGMRSTTDIIDVENEDLSDPPRHADVTIRDCHIKGLNGQPGATGSLVLEDVSVHSNNNSHALYGAELTIAGCSMGHMLIQHLGQVQIKAQATPTVIAGGIVFQLANNAWAVPTGTVMRIDLDGVVFTYSEGDGVKDYSQGPYAMVIAEAARADVTPVVTLANTYFGAGYYEAAPIRCRGNTDIVIGEGVHYPAYDHLIYVTEATAADPVTVTDSEGIVTTYTAPGKWPPLA